ncbi:MAG: hypothetical protein L3J06_06710 [Cyclobacteriaceae bacterium]|nr:hypothetical protein [Cyclobacteriaceae bacterium]
MSNSRKTIWSAFAVFMFIQLGSAYLTNKNQNNISFLMEMKDYIPYMLYFSLAGLALFLLSFMVYRLDSIKAKKQIAQLEQDKNVLKAKLFDLQEAQTSEKLPAPAIKPATAPTPETPAKPNEDTK